MDVGDASQRPVTIVLAGGDALEHPTRRPIPRASLVIAADGGLHHADGLDLAVDVLVGDLDSVDPDRLARAREAGIEVDEHAPDKDDTDLALALALAARRTPPGGRVLVVGGHGGRLDHLAANLTLLTGPTLAAHDVDALMGEAVVTVVRPGAPRRLRGRVDELVTLLALNAPARGVRTSGLAFPLDGSDLQPASSLGVSNRFARPDATVAIDDGVLLAIQPLPDRKDPWP